MTAASSAVKLSGLPAGSPQGPGAPQRVVASAAGGGLVEPGQRPWLAVDQGPTESILRRLDRGWEQYCGNVEAA